MTEPINIKMKMADPEQVTDLITDAVLTSFWASGLSKEWAGDLVRDIHRGFSDAGIVMIQVDNEATEAAKTAAKERFDGIFRS